MPSWEKREWICCIAGMAAGVLTANVLEPTPILPLLSAAMGFSVSFALMRVTAPCFHYARLIVGRFFVHLGLNVLPPGRVKREFEVLLEMWAEHIEAEVAAEERKQRGLY